MFTSVFGKSFQPAKCKTLLNLATARIKLLRNKRNIQLKQMRKELAQLLQTNQEGSARIRVEHIFREQNILAAYEIIELFCELIVVRLPIIESQSQCPIDLREAAASLVFAAPRCADLPELQQIRNLLAAKYGKEFVAAAAELRPDCGVNRLIIEKLSVRAPSGEVKLKLMTEIAAEHGVEWDPTASESELLKAPEDLLEGPNRFLGASEMSLQTRPAEIKVVSSVTEKNADQVPAEPETNVFRAPDASMGEKQFIPFVMPMPGDAIAKGSSSLSPLPSRKQPLEGNDESTMGVTSSTLGDKSFNDRESYRYVNDRDENFKDVAAAARAAAASAERAAAAARAAASLADGKSSRMGSNIADESSSDSDGDDFNKKEERLEEGPTGNYFKIKMHSFNHQFTEEKPVFDDYTEDAQSLRENRVLEKKKQSGKGFSFDYDQLDSPVERSSSKYNDDFIDQDNNRHHLDSRKSVSSKQWQFQNEDLRSQSIMGRSSHLSGAAPRFDTSSSSLYQRQQSNSETTDESVSQPPKRAPPSLSGANETESTKSVNKMPYVHPKLPDYDDLAARFESLRSKR